MRLQSLLAVLKEGTKVVVVDNDTDIVLGTSDGKQSLAEVLNHVQIERVDVMSTNNVDVVVNFDPKKYFQSFPKVVATMFIEWINKEHHVGLKKVESDYGMLYIDIDDYAHSIDSFIENVVVRHDDFVEYVLRNLELFDEERLAY